MKEIPGPQATLEERMAYLPRLRERAARYGAFKRMIQEDRDEFVSYASIEYLERGRHEMGRLYVDFRRVESSTRRTKFIESESHTVERDLRSLLLFIDDEETRDVLRLLADGLPQEDIAVRLSLSKSLVSQIVSEGIVVIRERLGLSADQWNTLLTDGKADV